MKPDFEAAIETYILASSGPDVSIERGASFILDALHAAFNAGLERAAEIARALDRPSDGDDHKSVQWACGYSDGCQDVIEAIRAEKEPK